MAIKVTKISKTVENLLVSASKSELRDLPVQIALVEQCSACGHFHIIQSMKVSAFVQTYGPMKKWVHKFVSIGSDIAYVVPGRHVCDDCHVANMYSLVRVFNRPDETIQSMTFCHGLLTGMCDYDHISPVTAMKKFMGIVGDMRAHDLTDRWELCAATMPIGPVGIRVSGQVNLAGNGDLWSGTGSEGGRRFGDPRHFYKLVTRREDLEVLSPGEDHNEIFIQVDSIKSAWVNASYPYRDELVEFFTAQGVPVC